MTVAGHLRRAVNDPADAARFLAQLRRHDSQVVEQHVERDALGRLSGVEQLLEA